MRSFLAFLGGDGFGNHEFGIVLLVKYFFIQKVLRINHRVGWPVHWTSKVVSPKNIERETRCPGLSMGCHIDGRNGIVFGKNVWAGPRVTIVSMNHDVNNFKRYEECRPVVIGDNCWLATNSVILPGVKLGSHTIVAAGCVVTKSFPYGDQVLAGVPTKVVKKIEGYD